MVNGETFIVIDGKECGLKISMWVADANRYGLLVAENPNSTMWKLTAMLWLAYQNYCRYKKQKPELTIDDVDLYVDQKYSDKEGQQEILALTGRLGDELKALNSDNAETTDDEQKKTLTGQTLEPLPLAKSA